MRPAEVACIVCMKPSVVVVNGRGGCRMHIDDAMALVAEVMQTVRKMAMDGRASTLHWTTAYEAAPGEVTQ